MDAARADELDEVERKEMSVIRLGSYHLGPNDFGDQLPADLNSLEATLSER